MISIIQKAYNRVKPISDHLGIPEAEMKVILRGWEEIGCLKSNVKQMKLIKI